MSFYVIGGGYGRTGTDSLRHALEILYDGEKCYHMKELTESMDDVNLWYDFITRREKDEDAKMDWDKIFNGKRKYVAAVDLPVSKFVPDLMEKYPKAKVILTVRDPNQWFQSYQVLIRIMNFMKIIRWVNGKIWKMFRVVNFVALQHIGDGSKEDIISEFNNHNQYIRDIVPKEKLLEFSVKQGWEPLCEFLGKDVPSVPFPHKNTKQGLFQDFVKKTAKDLYLKEIITITAPICAAAIGYYYYNTYKK